MQEETTRSLSKVLQSVRNPEAADSFALQYAEEEELHTYLNRLLAGKGISIPELIERSGVNRNYVYNILNGDRKNPGRDRVIALCIGLGADYRETNHALELTKASPLYPKDERDVRIAAAINQGIRDALSMNLILEERGLPLLEI